MNETRRLYFLPIVRRSFAYYLLTHQEVYLFLRGFVILLENLRLTFTANRNGKPQIYTYMLIHVIYRPRGPDREILARGHVRSRDLYS